MASVFTLMSLDFKSLKTLSVSIHDRVAVVEFTRPERLNSFTPEQYKEFPEVLKALADNDECSLVLWTGRGKYFCSGHDITAKGATPGAGPTIAALIDFPKPIIAAVNGPSVGIGVTALGLCDITYASETATFNTPFMKLGFCAEGCSSLLFPQIMGVSKASEVLLMGKTLTATEAERCQLVSEVLPLAGFRDEVLRRAVAMAKLPPGALKDTKALIRDANKRRQLHSVSATELTLLDQRMQGQAHKDAVAAFMARKTRPTASPRSKL